MNGGGISPNIREKTGVAQMSCPKPAKKNYEIGGVIVKGRLVPNRKKKECPQEPSWSERERVKKYKGRL